MWVPKTLRRAAVVFLGLLVMGQSCSISVGNTKPQTGGFYRSDDGGKTWRQKTFVSSDKKKNTTIAGVTGLTLAFDPSNPGTIYLGTRENGIWKTVNRGDRWTPTALRSGAYGSLAFNTFDTRILYTASGSIVSKSLDGGQAWETVYQESQTGHAVSTVAVDPARPDRVWAFTTGGKALLSENSGRTWTLKNSLPSIIIRHVVFDADGSGDLHIFAARGIYRLRQNGAVVENVSASLVFDKKIRGTRDIRALSILNGASPLWILGTAAGPLESQDRGASWAFISTVLKGSVPVENVAINPIDTRELYFTVGSRLHHTLDHGLSWSVTTLPSGLSPVLLAYDPFDQDHLYYSTFIPLKKK